MRAENNTCPFIELARMGRTDWRSVALTIFVVQFLNFTITTISVIGVVSPNFSENRLFHIVVTVLFDVAQAGAYIFGIWFACKKILKRPFLSLISTDMRFNIRRCFLGAALSLPVNVLGFMVISVFLSMRSGAWLVPFPHFEWPKDGYQITESISMVIVIPLLAFTEELFFRGWMTQTLGRYIRSPIIVVALVAILFAAIHTQYDLPGKILIAIYSLGLSALSLRDQRLELSIGMHSMMNICATLQSLFLQVPSLTR
jgi:uncharacterized protein